MFKRASGDVAMFLACAQMTPMRGVGARGMMPLLVVPISLALPSIDASTAGYASAAFALLLM